MLAFYDLFAVGTGHVHLPLFANIIIMALIVAVLIYGYFKNRNLK